MSSEQSLSICTSPLEVGSPELLEDVVAEYGRAYVELFCEHKGKLIERDSDGLVPLLRNWAASPSDFEVAWDGAFGLVRSVMYGPSISPIRAAVALALHLNFQGNPDDWMARMPESAHFLFGPVLIPPAVELRCFREGGSSRLTIVEPSGATRDFHLGELLEGRLPDSSGYKLVPRIEMGPHHLTLLTHSAASGLLPWGTTSDLTRYPIADCVRDCIEAFDLLRNHAAPFSLWIDRVLRHIVPLDGSDGFMRSASQWNSPGLVQISFPSGPVALAEMLVHEASHQYFHIVQRYAPTHDPDDQRLYFSPVKGTERPAEMILLAFHAFANVILFYRACAESGLDDGGYCRINTEKHLAELEVLVGDLRSMDSLTRNGHDLWEPLAERLFG